MTYTGVFVDDEDEAYADQLSTAGVLEIEFLPVDEVMTLAARITSRKCQLVALDYRLDESVGKLRPDQTFKGSALAQHLRDKAIEAPESDMGLVLVSAESKVRTLYRPDKTAHDLFDRVYVKEEINRGRDRVRREVVSLASAYSRLTSSKVPYDLAELTKADEGDRTVIDSQEFKVKVDDAKAPHLLVRTIFALLIDRTGPLMDIDDACAFLGVAQAAGPTLKVPLKDLQYEGLFGEVWARWWTRRVEDWAQTLFKRRPTGMPASDRAKILAHELDLDLAPAVSPWTGSTHELIAIACACCRRGVEIAHTVAVFEPALAKVSARRRICWDCVQTDAHVGKTPPLIIDEVDEGLAREIKTMARPSPTGGLEA